MSCGPATPSTNAPGSNVLPAGAPVWTAQLSGGSGVPSVSSLAVAGDGSVYVVGSFQGTLTAGKKSLSGGTADAAFVAKLGTNGAVVWTKAWPGTGATRALAVAAAGDRIVVAGTFEGALELGGASLAATASPDGFVAAITPGGDVTWAAHIGGDGATQVRDLALAADGTVVVAGNFDGALAVGDRSAAAEGMQDAFVLALSPTGAPAWLRTFGDMGPDSAGAVSFAPGGDVALAGSFFGDLDTGDGLSSADDTQDAFVLRLRGTTGEPVWARRLGDVGTESAHAVVVDDAGNTYVAGTFDEAMLVGTVPLEPAGNADVFLVKLDAAGAPVWARTSGGEGRDFAGRLALTGSTIAVTGTFQGTATVAERKLASAGGLDGFVATFGDDGTGKWAARFGGEHHDDLRGVALSSTGDITAAGAFDGKASFGPSHLDARGARDVIVLRIQP